LGKDVISDSVNQMCLAQSNAAVDEKRVVRGAGVFCDLKSRRSRQLICFAGDKIVETEFRD